MSEASVPSEVTLISGGYITAQSPSLGSQLSSLRLKTRALSEEGTTTVAQGGSLHGGH